MRILILSKRQYTNKDLLDDRYGRLYELPKELARIGHQVTGLCCSYRSSTEGHLTGPEINNTAVDWYSFNLGRGIFPGIFTYLSKLETVVRDFKPDIIWGCSDALHIINAYRLSQKYNIPCVADLYDNFESFRLTSIPGVRQLFIKAVQRVGAVTCVSSALQRYIVDQYRPVGKTIVLPNGIPSDTFYPMDRTECRKFFGLPERGVFIGTAGALGDSRGTDVLLRSAEKLITEDSSINLVLAGTLESGMHLAEGPHIHYLGQMDYSQIPYFFNTLDIGVICNVDSSFGRYCFPQKAYEMMACDLPVVAANVGTMSELFVDHPECLYAPDKPQSLVQSVQKQLVSPTFHDIGILSWQDLARELADLFLEIIGRKAN